MLTPPTEHLVAPPVPEGVSTLRGCVLRTLALLVALLAPAALFSQQFVAPVRVALPAGTAVKLRLAETLSSRDTQKGDRVDFVVRQDVVVDGSTVIRAGAHASGTVEQVRTRRMLGIPGKLVLHPDSVELADGGQAKLDAEIEFRGRFHLVRMAAGMVATSIVFLPASPVFLLVRGGDGMALKSSDLTAYLAEPKTVIGDALPAEDQAADLKDVLQFLPPRVLNGHGREGDMVNLIFVASEQELTDAFAHAGWTGVDQSKMKIAWHLFCHGTHYTRLPMAHFFLFGRSQDYSYSLPDPLSIVARRHHVRIWKTDVKVDGDPVWVAAATHDISIDLRLRRLHITHRIDPEVDAERDFIAANLADARAVSRTEYVAASEPVYEATTTEGQTYYSDSRLLLVHLRTVPENAAGPAAGEAASAQPRIIAVSAPASGSAARTSAVKNRP